MVREFGNQQNRRRDNRTKVQEKGRRYRKQTIVSLENNKLENTVFKSKIIILLLTLYLTFYYFNIPRRRPKSNPPLRYCNKDRHIVPETDFRRRPNGDFYTTCNHCREVPAIQRRRPRRPSGPTNPTNIV